jgi:hypothetical protein
MLDNILKLSNLFYKLASTWGGLIRGEWWLNEDGSSEFADIDIGEKGHEAIAIDSMIDKDIVLDELLEKYKKEFEDGVIDEEELTYYLNQIEEYSNNDQIDSSFLFFEMGIPDEIGMKAVKSPEMWKDIKYDARQAYSKYYGAIRVINNSFSTYKITDKTIEAIKDFLFQEADDLIEESDQEIEVEEDSTGNYISIPVKDFLEIKYPGQLWRLKDL